MNFKFFIIGIILGVVGVLIFIREIKKQVKPKDKSEMLLVLIRGLLAGENYSLATLMLIVGIMFVLYSLNIP